MDRNSITIRQGSPEDSLLLAKLGARTFAETFGPQNTPEDMKVYLEQAFKSEVILAEINQPGNVFFIAFFENEPVGYIKLRLQKPPKSVQGPEPIELERIYVLEEYTKQGIGGRLKEMALAEARLRGYRTIWLRVWKKNDKALRVYHRWGFKIVGEQTFTLGEDIQFDWVLTRPVDFQEDPREP
jgi:ribosomal protein S18 acetylase RimI-like enzyme